MAVLQKLKKFSLPLGGVVLLALLVLYMSGVFSPGVAPGKVAWQPVTFKGIASQQAVIKKKVPVWYEAVGTVSSRQRIVVSSRISGSITQAPLTDGQKVARNDLLVAIDDREFVTKLAQAQKAVDIAEVAYQQAIKTRIQAQAQYNQSNDQMKTAEAQLLQMQENLNAAEANFIQAKSEYQRMQELRKSGAGTQRQFEVARSNYLQAKAIKERAVFMIAAAKSTISGLKQAVRASHAGVAIADAGIKAASNRVQQAKKRVEEAQIALGYTRIKAYADGLVVVRKLVEVGDMALPGKALLILHDPEKLQFEADIRESLRPKVDYGKEFQVNIDALHLELQGKVIEIIPSADPLSRTFRIKLALPFRPGMYPGMFGRLRIVLRQEERLLVSWAAIRRIGQYESTVVKQGQGWSQRLVTTGRRRGALVEVLSGLQAGEIVAVMKGS